MKQLFSPYDIIKSGGCIGCGSCVAQANVEQVRMEWDVLGQLKPDGDTSWLNTKTETFSKICPFSTQAVNEDQIATELFTLSKDFDPRIGFFQSAYVGHVAEADFRDRGSSGGMVTWVATELLRRGLIDGVAHVVASENPQAEGRFFHYQISRTEAAIRGGAKSRYYPIEMSEILKNIRETPGRYAIVGIPCFIKAIQLLRRQDSVFNNRIKFTLGLFCGHLKSARFVESFAWQMNVEVNKIKKVEFRYKIPDRPANWYNAQLTLRDGTTVNKDWWHLADGDWGAGFFMNSACNVCDDVMAETADISFGDAWVEPYTSDGRGTNVVVVRSTLLDRLIQEARQENRLHLAAVNADFVAQTQAAGLRQRREGLAYRLTWWRRGVPLCKRVAPDARHLSWQRKLIYRLRYWIAAGSHRVFKLAKKLNRPLFYVRWAQLTTAIYYGWAYHQGKVGEMKNRFFGLKK